MPSTDTKLRRSARLQPHRSDASATKEDIKRARKHQKEDREEDIPVEDASEESSAEDSDDAFEENGDEDQDSDLGSAAEDDGDNEVSEEEEDVYDNQNTSKKRKRTKRDESFTATNKRKKNGTSRATFRRREKAKGKRHALSIYAPRETIDYSRLRDLPPDPLLRAMHVLHVGARPDALPCRENEYLEIMGAILGLLEEGSGGCIYVSGVPGTGKTATVHTVVRDLKAMAERSETSPFTYVEINGLKIPEPSAAYTLLWEAVSGHDFAEDGHLKISSKEALKKLNQHFSTGVKDGPENHAYIVLMDELDQLVTAKQDVIYNFFNWPNLTRSRLIVVAVANTHDLPERMSGKVRSRLGMIRINFQPYDTSQLQEIVYARLKSAKEGLEAPVDVIDTDAVRFSSMKVSGVSGDARRVLDILRRAVEFIRSKGLKLVKIPHVKQVIEAMQNSPTAAYLRDCSLHERIMLASLLKCIKREGVDEIRWGDVTHQHYLYMNSLTGEDDPKRKPTSIELALVLDALVASRAILVEDGIMVSRKAPGDRKLVLNIEAREVERELSDMGGKNWKNALGI